MRPGQRLDAWTDELPREWSVRKLKFIAAIRSSNVDKKSQEGEPPVRLCNYTDVYYNDRITAELDFMEATASRAEIARFQLRRGDVLITKDSESPDDIAVPAHVEQDLADVLCGYHLALIRPSATVDGRFLAYSMGATPMNLQLQAGANGITRYGLSLDTIGSSRHPFPPLEEQREISDYLDRKTAAIDAIIRKRNRTIELLLEKRQAMVSRLVTRGEDPRAPMRSSGVAWLGEIPAHWRTKRFRYTCRIRRGQIDPRSGWFRDWILVAPNHVEPATGRLLYTETAAEQGASSGKYRVEPGDLVYSKIRPALNKVCIAPFRCLCSADMYAIEAGNEIAPGYLLHLFLSRPLVRLMVDESMRVAMPKVNREVLADLVLLIPPRAEQEALVKHLARVTGRLDDLLDRMRRQVDGLREYRRTLVSAAVTGRLEVGPPEPALAA